MSDEELALWILAVTGGPFLGAFLLDTFFGTWARWWRWWYVPLTVALAGFAFLGWAAAQGQSDEPGMEHNWPLWFLLLFFVVPFYVLTPIALSAVGVGARRLLGMWVVHDSARQHERRQRLSGPP